MCVLSRGVSLCLTGQRERAALERQRNAERKLEPRLTNVSTHGISASNLLVGLQFVTSYNTSNFFFIGQLVNGLTTGDHTLDMNCKED